MQIKVYSVPSCTPCTTLKSWLKNNHIAYEEVSAGDLPDNEFERVTTAIISVSKLGQRSFPAVCIIGDYGEEYWISNHGSSDITEMTAEIRGII